MIRRCAYRPGFTLVELLAVLAAAGLLAAQIVPASRSAREDARRTLCQKRLGEIGRAALAYAASDPQEYGIPIGLGDYVTAKTSSSYYAYGGKSGQGTDTSPRLMMSEYSGAVRMNAHNRPLNHLLYKEPITDYPISHRDWWDDAHLKLDMFHCPGDQGFPGMHQYGWKNRSALSSYAYYGTSFAANALYVGMPGQSVHYSNSMYLHPLSDTPNPGNTVLYWENAARYAPWAPNTEDYEQSGCYWGTGLYARAAQENMVAHGNHGQDWHFSTNFADGHVEFIEVRGYGRTTGLNDELIANGFCAPSGSGTTCDCILVRGLGWQLDILPTPPVGAETKIPVPSSGPIPGPPGPEYTVVP